MGRLGRTLVVLGVDLWVGSVAMGLILGAITYVASRRLIVWYRHVIRSWL